MCISCGCGRYEDSHGDERNITVSSLKRASNAMDIPMNQILKNVANGCVEMLDTGVPDHQSRGEAVHERLRSD